jgi:hypothetical protein
MALGSTQPLVKMSTTNRVKAAGAWGWRPHHLHVPNVMKIWQPKPPGTLWATPGLLRGCFTFTFSLPYNVILVSEFPIKIFYTFATPPFTLWPHLPLVSPRKK